MTTQINPRLGVGREGGVHTVEDLRGPAGRLEALLNPGAPGQHASAAVLLCHPHPLFGGTLHNKVVYHAMKTLTGLGFPVLRFNFRGTGRSEGQHDGGRGEQEDVRAGFDWLAERFELPLLGVGFSFGAHMVLRAGCTDSRVRGLVSLGTPIAAGDRAYTYEFLKGCAKPVLFLSGAEDPFGPADAVEAVVGPAAANRQIVWIPGADHFFLGKLPLMQAALSRWLESEASAWSTSAAEVQEALR